MNSIDFLDKLDSFKTYKKIHDRNYSSGGEAHQPEVDRELSGTEKAEIAEKLNTSIKEFKDRNETISFSIDKESERVIMKVIDSNTNEVIREIPSKDLRMIYMHIQEFLGFFVDEER